MSALFTYGSLMCEDIFTAVTAIKAVSQKALLQGYRRFSIKNEHYPGIIQQSGHQVEGQVYSGISEAGWRFLDSFEGDLYIREKVVVHLEDGRKREAFAYVVKDEHSDHLSSSDWSFAKFLESGKAEFIERYIGFETLKDQHTSK